MMEINWEYLNLAKEVFFLARLEIVKRQTRDGRSYDKEESSILIVNPCLIGEFAGSIPAISDFIRKNKGKRVDLLVSPPLKDLAERLRGVGKVFTGVSVFRRWREINVGSGDIFSEIKNEIYDEVIVLRISGEVYRAVKGIKSRGIKTSFFEISGYGFHLAKSLLLGRPPKNWRTVNFEMLGGRDSEMLFEEIFQFSDEDKKRAGALINYSGSARKIIIHTGTNWPMKSWPKEKWVALLEEINQLGDFEFIFVGSDEDRGNFDYISSRLIFGVKSLINKTSLVDLVIILSMADYFISIDGGPSNLACLVGLRGITILGAGPHFHLNSRGLVVDKTGGRGLMQMFFSIKNSFINRVQVGEVREVFKALLQKK